MPCSSLRRAIENDDLQEVVKLLETTDYSLLTEEELQGLFVSTFFLREILPSWWDLHLKACICLAKRGHDYLLLLRL